MLNVNPLTSFAYWGLTVDIFLPGTLFYLQVIGQNWQMLLKYVI